ncbi:MAG: potassium channel family protein [Aeromicrobium sp.]|uniref:potassium channel family protein n=1 Tax=Aeromicrobium sp. TaxID=1871063 RepID=UPI0039E2DC96
MDGDLRSYLRLVSWTTWAAFAIDFAIRVGLAHGRPRYIARHWYDVVLIALPLLRPLRLLRLLTLVRVLDRGVGQTFVGRAMVYVAGSAVVTIGLGALAVLDVERDAVDANITSFGDALWWSVTTATTVGYGDHFPVTVEGRCVAVVLMVVGIGLIGATTGAVATWLIEHARADESAKEGV